MINWISTRQECSTSLLNHMITSNSRKAIRLKVRLIHQASRNCLLKTLRMARLTKTSRPLRKHRRKILHQLEIQRNIWTKTQVWKIICTIRKKRGTQINENYHPRGPIRKIWNILRAFRPLTKKAVFRLYRFHLKIRKRPFPGCIIITLGLSSIQRIPIASPIWNL